MNPKSNQIYRVLVVDDEKNIRLMLRNALETDGYEVIEAENGKQALDELEGFRPDVVLLDLSMPVMDGMRFLGELRELDAADRPAVVVLTAYGSISAAVQAMKLGAREFIEKPSTPDDIRTAVEQAIVDQAMKPDSDELKAPTY
ncbi:MAG TPA: response regulator, partial [Tepidisphaeraceae bacterium]|nr:response regulator [Tepidisphaeraceae bacterium]